jgi:hypothetical protein
MINDLWIEKYDTLGECNKCGEFVFSSVAFVHFRRADNKQEVVVQSDALHSMCKRRDHSDRRGMGMEAQQWAWTDDGTPWTWVSTVVAFANAPDNGWAHPWTPPN